VTGVFSETAIAPLLDRAQGKFARYEEGYCVVVLEPTVEALARPATTKDRALMRHVGAHIRSDIRLMDEAARLSDGRLLVLLPHTAKQGGLVVAERLSKGIQSMVGTASTGSFSVVCFGAAEDADALGHLRATMAEPVVDHSLSEASPA
jgi:hypothetical protein